MSDINSYSQLQEDYPQLTPEEKQLRHNAVYGQDAILKGHNGT
jgi:hypothetical protein